MKACTTLGRLECNSTMVFFTDVNFQFLTHMNTLLVPLEVTRFRLNCTGEEEWTALFAQRAMVFRLDSGQWTQKHTGELKIMKHTSQCKLVSWMSFEQKGQILKQIFRHRLSFKLVRMTRDSVFFEPVTENPSAHLVQFSLVQVRIYALGKAHMRSTLFVRSSPMLPLKQCQC